MQIDEFNESITGIWCDGENIHLSFRLPDASVKETSVKFSPFLWTSSEAKCDYAKIEKLSTPSDGNPRTPLDAIMKFESVDDMERYFKSRDKSLPSDRISSVENQYLTANGARMFEGVEFKNIRRLQLDIEVMGTDGFPVATRDGDRILAVGLSGVGGTKILELADFSDASERKLLEDLQQEILSRDPDTIEGHNIFKFDLPYISARAKKLKASMKWGRFGGSTKFRKSRISIAERTFAYTRCDIAGRTVVDTLILSQLYDISAREMASYTLKAVAVHFGISKPENRTYLAGDKIGDVFNSDRETFRAYLLDDLRETEGVAAKLLPTYVAQVRNFPMTLQECLLRGTGMKVESVFLEKYLSQNAALPQATLGDFIEGALSESYETGVFKNVLHYDVASLYPSLMLALGKCPRNDYLKIFLTQLSELREYRFKYKKLARETQDADLKSEYDARQKSFKILINSFYGYLGLSTALFGDSSLASEITRTGRELLSKLVDFFKSIGCVVLEADTDGIYLSSEKYFNKPEELLAEASKILPNGVDLEFDGSFDAMLCYKAKNYALLNGDDIILRGSALRNRSTEPYLRKLTEAMVKDKLKGRDDLLESEVEKFKSMIFSGEMSIEDLSKGEYISKSPEQYKSDVLKTGKGRRAALEAALLMERQPEVGDKVLYYITKGTTKRDPDWKRARPTSNYDPSSEPYDADYYAEKIDDLLERFSDIFASAQKQGELF